MQSKIGDIVSHGLSEEEVTKCDLCEDRQKCTLSPLDDDCDRDECFKGEVTEFEFYPRVLTEKEILEKFNNGIDKGE